LTFSGICCSKASSRDAIRTTAGRAKRNVNYGFHPWSSYRFGHLALQSRLAGVLPEGISPSGPERTLWGGLTVAADKSPATVKDEGSAPASNLFEAGAVKAASASFMLTISERSELSPFFCEAIDRVNERQ
jgi:hypothetical protein